MLNACSILNQTDELVDLAQHMNVDIIGITAAGCMMELGLMEFAFQVTPYFVKATLP